jgi:ribosomal protein S18 acetylase RimI-like enzyme
MIRRLLLTDADAVLRLRREALESEPLAFSSSPTEDRVQMPGMLDQYLAHRTKAIFGAFEPGLIGMAGIMQEEGAKSRHKARLWGVYVVPSGRGAGVGRALVEAAIEFARSLEGLTHVHLCVAESGHAAQALYSRLGFRTWGMEPAAMRVGEVSVAEHHMVLALRPDGAEAVRPKS